MSWCPLFVSLQELGSSTERLEGKHEKTGGLGELISTINSTCTENGLIFYANA